MAAAWNAYDSDEEFEKEDERFSGKTALLVVIDSSPAMFQGWEENQETPFLAAIKCCESIWRSKVVSNAKDLVSILLIGTEKEKNSSSFPNLYQLQDLSSVKVDMIKQLIEMKNSPDLNGFQDEIGSSNTYDMKDLFWLAKIIFDEGKTQTFTKKLIYFTCEDNPHAGKRNLQQDVIKKFKDLGKVEFNIVTFKENFQFDKFYSNLIEDESSIIYSKDLDSLMKVVRMKQRLKRPISRSTLEIAPGMKIGIGYYSFVRPAQKPKYVSINRRNNEVVERSVNVFRSDSGMPILKSEERKFVQVQGETALFTAQEVKDIKYVHEPGIKLLGFLNMANFDHFSWYRSPGYFLYPDDERISGSKEMFTALLKRCHALEKAPLVRMVLSRGRTPKLGCLIPSIPDDATKSIFPQGFHIFPIPFSDEMRNVQIDPYTQATPEFITLMEKVVKKLSHKRFDPLDVKNPALQSMWKKLEEEALEIREEDSEDLFDYTEPNEDLMQTKLGNIPLEMDQQIESAGNLFMRGHATAPVKKFRIDVAMEAKHGRLERLTCAQMKDYLESQNVKVPLVRRKAELIADINNFLGIEK